MSEILSFPGLEVEVNTRLAGNGGAKVRLGTDEHEVSELARDGSRLSFVLEGQRHEFDVLVGPSKVELAGRTEQHTALRKLRDQLGAALPAGLTSQMPGKVLRLLVAPGSVVQAGAPLLIVEAMKMEHEIAAPADGLLRGFPVSEGQRVMPGDTLADFEPAADL